MRALVGGLIALALAQAGQARTGSISGTVVSTLANAPVGGAVIIVAKVGGPASEYRVVDGDGLRASAGLTPAVPVVPVVSD